jgi:hypothetical protein
MTTVGSVTTSEEAAVVIDIVEIVEIVEIVVCARGHRTLVVQRVDVLDQYL